MAVVQLDRLSKHYPGTALRAVDDVSMTVAHGEFMVLLGPSGCGKSTTLRMIAGLESISGGTVSIDGEVVNQVPAKDRDIAMVFQSYALYPHMSVRDNMAFGLRRRGFDRSEIARRVDDAAQAIGLTDYLGRKPHALSGGQRQRVALGRAIVRDPKVFLFDEPLSNLDAALRVSTRAELTRLHHRLGATMIYVTHDQVEAMTMGSRICIMQDGAVRQIGAPMEVYRNPADTFVASFLGSPPMNLLPAELDGGGIRLGGQALSIAAPDRSNGTAILGVRPEDIVLGPADADDGMLSGRIVAIEPLGAETLVRVAVESIGEELMVRAGRTVRQTVDDMATLRFDGHAVRMFDRHSGRRLTPEIGDRDD